MNRTDQSKLSLGHLPTSVAAHCVVLRCDVADNPSTASPSNVSEAKVRLFIGPSAGRLARRSTGLQCAHDLTEAKIIYPFVASKAPRCFASSCAATQTKAKVYLNNAQCRLAMLRQSRQCSAVPTRAKIILVFSSAMPSLALSRSALSTEAKQ